MVDGGWRSVDGGWWIWAKLINGKYLQILKKLNSSRSTIHHSPSTIHYFLVTFAKAFSKSASEAAPVTTSPLIINVGVPSIPSLRPNLKS